MVRPFDTETRLQVASADGRISVAFGGAELLWLASFWAVGVRLGQASGIPPASGQLRALSSPDLTVTTSLPIETERLAIRPPVPDDAEALHELYSDAVAMQHLESDLSATVMESRQWVLDEIDLHERTGLSMWAVVERDSGGVVGDAGLQLFDAIGTIGVRLIGRHWDMGYGQEAAAALLEAGFRELEVDRIIGVTAPGNVRARRAMERLGMPYVGREHHSGRKWVVYEARQQAADLGRSQADRRRPGHELVDAPPPNGKSSCNNTEESMHKFPAGRRLSLAATREMLTLEAQRPARQEARLSNGGVRSAP